MYPVRLPPRCTISMTNPRVPVALVALLASTFLATNAFAAEPYPDAPIPTGAPAAAVSFTPVVATRAAEVPHKFWDRQNTVLFAATAAMSGVDFAVTRSNLQRGGQELNPVVRMFGNTTAGLAVNFVGETAGVVAVSYFFHKTGHHKLERVLSVVNLGASAGAVSYGLSHR